MTTDEAERMLDIQDRLRADRDGSERLRLAGTLDTLRAELRRSMEAGVAPAEFRQLESLSDAAASASEVLEAASVRYRAVD